MNVLQISTSDDKGGSQHIALMLHGELNRLGHDARLMVGHKINDIPKTIEVPNLRHRNLLARLAYKLPYWLRHRRLRGARMAEKVLMPFVEPFRSHRVAQGYEDFDFPGTAEIPMASGFTPDLFHAHNLHGEYFDLRVLPGLSQATPFLITLHDAWLLAGHCAHSYDCQKWVEGCGACPQLETPIEIPVDNSAMNWRIKRDIYSQSHLYVACVSQFLLDKVQRSMLKPRLARLIHNGVDSRTFHPAFHVAEIKRKLELPEDSRVVMFIAIGADREHPWKDLPALEAVVEILMERYQAPEKLILLCVGRNGRRKKVGNCEMIFTGYVNDPASMAAYFQVSDLYLHPAKIDTFPNVILEAMACAIPCIASSVGGIPEQITDGWNGFLCPQGDAVDMAEKCLMLLENKGLREKMSQNSLALVAEKFSLERQMQAYQEFYADICEDFKSISNQTV